MILPFVFIVIASLIWSGVLVRHQRVLTYIATVAVLVEAQWLLLTLGNAVIWSGGVSATKSLLISILLMIIALIFVRSWQKPVFSWGREVSVIVVLIVMLSATTLIVTANGYVGDSWVMHGFYNGDTTTLVSLVQRSLTTGELVSQNLFAAGGPLEYPTLLHGGIASAAVTAGPGLDWIRYLPFITLMQIAITVPMFFLLFDVVIPEPKEDWKKWLGISNRVAVHALQAAGILYVMALSWDNYIYPQSHFFLTGMFLLMTALLLKGGRERFPREYLSIIPASVIALVLMLANAVTGTIAVAITASFYMLRAGDKSRPVWQRGKYLLGILGWVILFLLFTPGEAAFGLPQFSYTAAGAMTRLALPLIALLAATWLARDKHALLGALVSIVTALGLFTFFFSTRDIVVENAERFFYHAILIGFPLVLGPTIQLYYWLRRGLVYNTLSFAQRITGWSVVITFILVLLLPAGASVASAHDHLMFKSESVVTGGELRGLVWINTNTLPGAIVLASPEEPWTVPFFTGRSLVRIDHWLSLQDDLLDQVVAAFEGETTAQNEVLQEADFLLLTSDEQLHWKLDDIEPEFQNSEIRIYKL